MKNLTPKELAHQLYFNALKKTDDTEKAKEIALERREIMDHITVFNELSLTECFEYLTKKMHFEELDHTQHDYYYETMEEIKKIA